MASIELERLEKDKAEYEQLKLQALMDIRNPEAALVNYHRVDAVIAYINSLIEALQTPKAEA